MLKHTDPMDDTLRTDVPQPRHLTGVYRVKRLPLTGTRILVPAFHLSRRYVLPFCRLHGVRQAE